MCRFLGRSDTAGLASLLDLPLEGMELSAAFPSTVVLINLAWSREGWDTLGKQTYLEEQKSKTAGNNAVPLCAV